MGEIIATTGPDLVSGEISNVSADFYGTLRLSSSNLIPDPGLLYFDEETQKHKYWILGEAPRPTHWNVFVRDRNTVKQFSRQLADPIPLRDNVFDLQDELVRGAAPLELDRTIDIAPPDVPKVEAVATANTGFPAGFYTIAFGWILGEDWKTTSRVTNPGPRSPALEDAGLQLAQGDGMLITLPTTEVPAKVTGVIIFVSEPRDTAIAALSAPLYEAARFAATGVAPYQRLVGPFAPRRAKDNNNDTFVGNKNTMPALQVIKGDNPYGVHTRPIVVKLAYSFYTESGISQSSTPTGWMTLPVGKDSFQFRPKNFPKGVIGWRPEVQFRVEEDSSNKTENNTGVGEWFSISKSGNKAQFHVKEFAGIYVAKPENWDDNSPNTKLVKMSPSGTDNTGVPAPTEPLTVPTRIALNSSGLTPGPHWVKTSLMVGDDEGPSSDPVRQDVLAGQALRIYRPYWHNVMDNSDLGERLPSDITIPRGWEIYRPFPTIGANSASCTVNNGWLTFVDKTNGNTDYNVFRSGGSILVPGFNRYIMRYRIEMSEYTLGKFLIILDEYDSSGALIQSQNIETYADNQSTTVVVRLTKNSADFDNPSVLRLNNNTTSVRLRGRAVGTGRAGTRNYKIAIRNFGVFKGWAAPRKIDLLEFGRNRGAETDDNPYPHGGYCAIHENPTDGPLKDNAQRLETLTFEDGTIGTWTYTSTGGIMSVNKNAAISGSYGMRLAKTTAGTSITNSISKTFASSDKIAVAWDVYIKSVSDHTVIIGYIFDSADNLMAYVKLSSNGDVSAVYVPSSGNSVTNVIARGVESGDFLSVELEMSANSAGGTLAANVGKSRGNRYRTLSAIGINWTGRQPAKVSAGSATLDVALSTWDIYFDNIVVSRNGLLADTLQPGNYIEYYGPANTPKNDRYGPYGMKVPCLPNTNYSFGVNIWSRDLDTDTSLLKIRAMDKNGKTIRIYSPLVDGISGDRDWTRFTKTVLTPPGTAYIEFFSNNIGAGRVKIHGLQMEAGTTSTAFTMTNARSGYMRLFFSTLQDGMSKQDPMYRLAVVKKLKSIRSIVTDYDTTSYQVQYRSGDTLTNLPAYVTDYNLLDVTKAFIEVRIDLSSTNDFDSPEVRKIVVDLERYDSHLCRENGTEFKGGTLVNNISNVHAPQRSENVELASGDISYAPWGTKRVSRLYFDLHCFRKSTAEEIARNKLFTIVTLEERLLIRLEEDVTFTPAPDSRIYISYDNEFFQHYFAEGLSGIIMSREVF